MSQETGRSAERSERKELPIERGFPIERVNEIASKETTGGAREYYRPIYCMHKWWARRAGSVFRAICLYTLVDDPDSVEVFEPGDDASLDSFTDDSNRLDKIIDNIDLSNPEGLWELYPKDVRINDKSVLDPFMGGGTSLGEASRFGANVVGNDLNPVAWFITKKEMDAHKVDLDELKEAFNQVKEDVKEDIQKYYRTTCPNNEDHKAGVMYYLWVKELNCVSCNRKIPLFRDYRVGRGRYDNKGKYSVYCPECNSVILVDDWQSECECGECGNVYTPKDGNATRGGNYICKHCGQKYAITDAIQEQGGYDLKQYALEYFCSTCDEQGLSRGEKKGYKRVSKEDTDLYKKASSEWKQRDDLNDYIPSEKIPSGAITAASSISGNDVFQHGYQKWSDMFNDRQLLCLSRLLQSIDEIENEKIKEYLTLAFSECLNYNTMMTGYDYGHNGIVNIFKSNSFDPPQEPAENNLWGLKEGKGQFRRMFDKMKRGIEYAQAPTDRYISNGDTVETPPFNKPVGESTSVRWGDARDISATNEYDAVITDPPYYDNIVYSELSDYFYVWQKRILSEHYTQFKGDHTPRTEIVENPSQNLGASDFEEELTEAFEIINESLKQDGALVFTYHHSDSESWAKLLEALCEAKFEVTATYPVAADLTKLSQGERISFDIIVVARPSAERIPISWNSLRRNIYRTAQETQERLENSRELSRGDIGVVEMGECFYEYSKHHGKVQRAGKEMTAKEVVSEIYGIIQEGSDIGEIDVFLDLLETTDASYNDLNKLTQGTNASPEQMKDMRLYRRKKGKFILGTWDDEKRMAYIQERVNGDGEALNALDKAQFLRYRYEQGKSTQNYLSKWDVDDDLRELCEGLADATGDDTYRRILGADSTLGDY